MKKFNYEAVWGCVDSDKKVIKVMGKAIDYMKREIVADGNEPIAKHVVSRSHLHYIINKQGNMKKSVGFIEKLAVRFEKELDKMSNKYSKKGTLNHKKGI